MAAMIDAYILRCDYDNGPYRGYVWRIENTLKALQSYVDGPIEALALTPEIVVICHEEGKLHQFPINRACMDGKKVLDFFCGNLLSVRCSGGEFASIEPEDIAVIERLLIPLKSVSKEGDHAVFVTVSADHCPEWRPFYAIDFSSLSSEEKCELMCQRQ